MTDYALNLPMRGGVTSGMDAIFNMPRVRVTRTAAFATPGSTLLTVPWDQEVNTGFPGLLYNNDGMWSAVDPTKITAHTAGLYSCHAQWYFGPGATNTTTYRQMYFQTSNGRVYAQTVVPPVAGFSVGTTVAVHDHIPLNAGEYFIVNLAHNDTSVGSNMGSDSCFVAASMISTL